METIKTANGAQHPIIAVVGLYCESGCNPKDDEYEIFLQTTSLPVTAEDIESIFEAVRNEFDFDAMKVETPYTVVLYESGEREDQYVWNAYFRIENIHEGKL